MKKELISIDFNDLLNKLETQYETQELIEMISEAKTLPYALVIQNTYILQIPNDHEKQSFISQLEEKEEEQHYLNQVAKG